MSGAVGDVVTRPLMRAVVLVTHGTPSFSLPGTAGIAVVYTLLLLPGCVTLAGSRGRWPWFLLSAGVLVLLFEAMEIGLDETRGAGSMSGADWAALVLILVAMAAAYAAQVSLAARWSVRHGVRSGLTEVVAA